MGKLNDGGAFFFYVTQKSTHTKCSMQIRNVIHIVVKNARRNQAKLAI